MNTNRIVFPRFGSAGLGQPVKSPFEIAILADWAMPRKLFKRFDLPEHADALARGEVWVNTLSYCRQNSFDRLEGTRTFHTGILTSRMDGGSDRLAWAARLLGFHGLDTSREGHVRIVGCTVVERIPDAHVLCMTQHVSLADAMENLGPGHFVEISEPERFAEMVTAAYFREFYSPGDTLPRTHFGNVRYAHREFAGHQPSPGPVGFVNPDDFEPENEVRILWTPKGSTEDLSGRLLSVPDAAPLCRRVS